MSCRNDSSTLVRMEASAREDQMILANLDDAHALCAILAAMVEVRVEDTEIQYSAEYRNAFADAGLFAESLAARKSPGSWLASFFFRQAMASAYTPWRRNVDSCIEQIQAKSPIAQLFLAAGFQPLVCCTKPDVMLESIVGFDDIFEKIGIQFTCRAKSA